jgi:hypothetical protein
LTAKAAQLPLVDAEVQTGLACAAETFKRPVGDAAPAVER